MEVGDNVVLKNSIDIGEFKKHGIIININNSAMYVLEILFADGVIENYGRVDVRVISDKEYFKLQLS